jgi:Ca2+-transporting ATPase
VTGLTLGLLGLALYLPWLARLFFFEPLSISNLFLAVALGGISVLWFEAMKLSRKFSSKL